MDPYSMTQIGLTAYSLLSGADAEANANRAQIASNNLSLIHI